MFSLSGRTAVFAVSLILGSALFGEAVSAREGLPDGLSVAATPRAVKVARTRVIPACTRFVDAAAAPGGTGTAARPFKTIAAAAAAAPASAIICVAQGVYRETLLPGTKPFTLAGGFQSGKAFKVRNSARYVSKAHGNGAGSFIRIEDPGPTGNQLTAIDGFEITGYSQAIYATSMSRSVSTSPTTTSTTTNARRHRSPVPASPSTMSPARSAATSFCAIAVIEAGRAS